MVKKLSTFTIQPMIMEVIKGSVVRSSDVALRRSDVALSVRHVRSNS